MCENFAENISRIKTAVIMQNSIGTKHTINERSFTDHEEMNQNRKKIGNQNHKLDLDKFRFNKNEKEGNNSRYYNESCQNHDVEHRWVIHGFPLPVRENSHFSKKTKKR